MELKNYIPLVMEAAKNAGEEILSVYQSEDFSIEQKEDDSPLTKADQKAHELIAKALNETDFPILSEEGRTIPFAERKNWTYFWMVDPLDGTKEFIKRNDEFSINIALIYKNKPVLGVIYAPVWKKLYVGGENLAAKVYTNQKTTVLTRKEQPLEITRILTSRSHLSSRMASYVLQFPKAEITPMGSSLKFMHLAEAKAEIYPRFSPTMEWDTAAAHAILKSNGLGIEIINQNNGKPLQYNKENLQNPNFIVKRR